jgi:hypothetical protein
MLIIGGLEDQLPTLAWALLPKDFITIVDPVVNSFLPYTTLFHGLSNPWTTTQPITWLFGSLSLGIFGAGFYNIWILLTLIINLALTFNFFKRFKYPVLYSLLFCLSPFFISHIGRHIDLMQIWVFPLFFNILFESHMYDSPVGRKGFVIGLVLGLALLVSNYYGYFILMTYLIFSLIRVIQSIREKDNGLLVRVISSSVIGLSIFTIIVGLVLSGYIKSAFYNNTELPATQAFLKRPYEDFFSFSSRPWYYFIPSIKNPIYGELAQRVYINIQKSNYFLADDYFVYEHSGNFFGYSLLLLLLVSLYKLYPKLNKSEKCLVNALVFTALGLFVISMPPFFTISGMKIYLPSQILSKLFPMFRVLARLSVVIHLLLLTILAILLNNITATRSRRIQLALLGILIFFETYIPLKLEIKVPSDSNKLVISDQYQGSRIYFYPNSNYKDALFHLNYNRIKIMNLYNDIDKEIGENFSRGTLNTLNDQGLLPENIDYVAAYETNTQGLIEVTLHKVNK